MEKGRKIRNLVETDNISVCLNDILMEATKMVPDLINLEYGNKKSHLKEAKRKARDLEKMIVEFKKRLNGEVFEEVHDYAAKNKHRYKTQTENLDKMRNH